MSSVRRWIRAVRDPDRILSTRCGTVLLQEAPEYGKSWLVVPVLVHVRDRRYQLDWESQPASRFTMIEALSLPLLPGVDAAITQHRAVIDRDGPPTRHRG